MGLFFKHRINELPVVDEGQVRGSILKDDLVGRLRKTDQFSRDVVQLIDDLLKPANKRALDRLRSRLERGEINGIPIINLAGELQRVITPGILQAETQAGEFLDQTAQRAVFEKLLAGFPFPVKLEENGQVIFENKAFKTENIEAVEPDWETVEFEEGKYSVNIFMPAAVLSLHQAFNSITDAGSFDLRRLLDEIESNLLHKAQQNAETMKEAARMVGLPRQTYNYRLNKDREES